MSDTEITLLNEGTYTIQTIKGETYLTLTTGGLLYDDITVSHVTYNADSTVTLRALNTPFSTIAGAQDTIRKHAEALAQLRLDVDAAIKTREA